MKKPLINRAKIKYILVLSFVVVFAQAFVAETFGQKSKPKVSAAKTQVKKSATAPILPKVMQIDEVALKNLLIRNGENVKPLLINFWATWCDPCREEFPELVEIDKDYKEKIDFITISLDDVEELNRAVPKFLVNMKAQMPAYLLKTDDEEAAIASVTKDWQGGLPFTVLLNDKGEIAYIRQGKIKSEVLITKINELINGEKQSENFIKGKADAVKDLSNGLLIYKIQYHSSNGFKKIYQEEEAKITIEDVGMTVFSISIPTNATIKNNIVSSKEHDYIKGYNSVSEPMIVEKIGSDNLKKLVEKSKVNSPADVVKVKLTVN